MVSIKYLAVFGMLCVCLGSFSACSSGGQRTSTQDNAINRPVAGNEETSNYAERPVTTEQGNTDPYTGTQDTENTAGNHPMAENQTAADKMHQSGGD